MIAHHLKIAFRNMRKYKTQNIISIIGLATGFTFLTIGYNWMKYETSYDGFYPDSKNIYRIYGIDKQSDRTLLTLPLILLETLKKEFPEVEKVTAIYPRYGSPILWEKQILGNIDFTYVDEHFLELFPPKFICGKTDHLLYTPDEVVITEKFAKKYWNSPEEAIGNVLSDRFVPNMKIVAVMKNPPANSNFHTDGFRANINGRQFYQQMPPDRQWVMTGGGQIFVLLNEKVDISTFRQKIRNYAIDNKLNENLEFQVIPVTDMRHTLGADLSFNLIYIRTFAGAGLLLLFCSMFNFLNLYVNRMLQRTREIKLRKTVGGSNFSIIKQLQIELIVQLVLVFVVSCLLMRLSMPIFEQQFETGIITNHLWSRFFIISMMGFAFLVLACLFAEIRLTRFSSLSQTVSKFNNRLFRNTSISLQLAICIFFLMSALIFFRQVSFMNHFDWGFKKDGLIRITMSHRNRELIVDNIKQLASIQEFIPTGLFNIKNEPRVLTGEVKWVDKPEGLNPIIEVESVGKIFATGFDIPIVRGRFFDEKDINPKCPLAGSYFLNVIDYCKNPV